MFCCSLMANSFWTACASSRDLTFFSRSRACSRSLSLRVLDDLRPARLGFGLEVLPAAAGIEGQERGALLDLVGGDRLVVDEHDDGLLALGGAGPSGFSALGAAGCAAAWRGAFWAASCAGALVNANARGRARTPRAAAMRRAAMLMHGGRAGLRGRESTANESYRRAAGRRSHVIHRTTVALAWQTVLARAFGGWDGPGLRRSQDRCRQ